MLCYAPLNQIENGHNKREKEIFKVNFAWTEKYRKSAIPYCQRLLNEYETMK